MLNARRKDKAPLAFVSEIFRLGTIQPDTGREGRWRHMSVTKEEISLEWQRIVSWIKSELEKREQTQGRSVTGIEHTVLSSPKSALEGGLWIR